MLGKVDVRVRLSLLEFSHQILVADIVDEVILGTDNMNAYGFRCGIKRKHPEGWPREDKALHG